MNSEKNLERLNELRDICRTLYDLQYFVMGCDPSQSYDEYMSESVGELLYGDEERDGLINDDFVHNTIEQDMKYHKETLKEVIKICEAKS